MSGRPNGFPGADHTGHHIPDDVRAHLDDIFGAPAPTVAAGASHSSAAAHQHAHDVIADLTQAHDALSALVHAHLPDWLL